MKRIDVTQLGRVTADILRSWTAPSWRDDAYDPEADGDDSKIDRKRPKVKIYPAFADYSYDHLYHDLDSWV